MTRTAERAGTAEIVTAGEARVAGSHTAFSLRLPDGAACPGDSADDGYRVNTFMVPATLHVEEVTFDGQGPTPNAYGDSVTFRQPLYDTTTAPYVSAQTADATAPGEPGVIVGVPSFSFGVYRPGELPPGAYHLGVACTLENRLVRYWDTEISVSASAADHPAGITWQLPNDAGPNGASAPTASLPLLAAAIVGAALVIALRRRRHVGRARPLASLSEDR